MVSNDSVVKIIRLFFTVECPHCGALLDKNSLEFEVFVTGTNLGPCPGCGNTVIMELTTRSPDWEGASNGVHEA